MRSRKLTVTICLVVVGLISCLIGFRSELFDSGESSSSHGYGGDIAQIINYGSSVDDKGYNEGVWDGILSFTNQNETTRKYYQCLDNSDQTIVDEISLAIKGNAKILFCPGYVFSTPVWKAQQMYDDVWLILIDGVPVNETGSDTTIGDHTVSVSYAEEQSGFLAGYAAVMDGYRQLGFMGGMAQPAVIRFGYGFCHGADYAAEVLNLAPGAVRVRYTYTGTYSASPEILSQASSWYQSGTEVIFSCGGAIVNSIMKAAETNGGKVIGVDVDQSYQSETVITSAMKYIRDSVVHILEDHQRGTLQGGTVMRFDAAMNCVGLPMETSRFRQFTREQYDEIYQKLASGEIQPPQETAASDADGLPLELVEVEVIK